MLQSKINERLEQDKLYNKDILLNKVKEITNVPENYQIEETDKEKLTRAVRAYGELDGLIVNIKKEIDPYKKQLKNLTDKKKEIEKELTVFMSDKNIGACNITQDKEKNIEPAILKLTETTSCPPVTKNIVKDQITNFFNNNDFYNSNFLSLSSDDKAECLYNFIYNNRPKVNVLKLKKVKRI